MPDYERNTFAVSFKATKLIGDRMPRRDTPRVLVIHGAGNSSRNRYDYLRLLLAEDEIATCAFDMIGHGDTGGNLFESNLQERTQQAGAVIDSQIPVRPFGIIGGSMGAYTAIKLTENYPVDRLVLLVPAAYSSEVYQLPFNEGFTRKLREPDSWKKSDAWTILSTFTGKLLIMTAEYDEIVSPEIPQLLYQSATKAKLRNMITIKGSTHSLNRYLAAHQKEKSFIDFYEAVKEVLG